ncbi:MAG: hypothetical protein JKY67_00130 [Pseudomonadales bacterium]|nr:hypothetical protein [Pseudomonadales bacterium]
MAFVDIRLAFFGTALCAEPVGTLDISRLFEARDEPGSVKPGGKIVLDLLPLATIGFCELAAINRPWIGCIGELIPLLLVRRLALPSENRPLAGRCSGLTTDRDGLRWI